MTSLIHIGPIVSHGEPSIERIRRFRAGRVAYLQSKITETFEELRALQRLHEALRRTLPRPLRAKHDLLRVTIAWDDSSQVAVPMRGVPPSAPALPPPPKGDLRDEARRRGVPIPMLWDRFPPSTPAERALMNKELGRYYAKQAPQAARSTGDGFATFLRQQARDAAKLAKSPDLYGRLLADSEWKARQRAAFEGVKAISIEDLL